MCCGMVGDLENIASNRSDNIVNVLDHRVDTGGEVALDLADERVGNASKEVADTANEAARGEAVNSFANTTESRANLAVEDGRALDNTLSKVADSGRNTALSDSADELANSVSNTTNKRVADDSVEKGRTLGVLDVLAETVCDTTGASQGGRNAPDDATNAIND